MDFWLLHVYRGTRGLKLMCFNLHRPPTRTGTLHKRSQVAAPYRGADGQLEVLLLGKVREDPAL